MTWDTTTPLGSDNVRQGDDKLREMWQDMETALQASGRFPIDTSNPEYQYIPDMGNTASRPATTEGGLYYNSESTINALQRDNGSGYDQVGYNFPDDTVAAFFNSSAPNGWQIIDDDDMNNRLLYVDDENGGTKTGDWDVSADSGGAHTHNVCRRYDNGTDTGIYCYTQSYGGSRYYRVYTDVNYMEGDSGANEYNVHEVENGTISNGDDFVSQSYGNHTHTIDHDSGEHQTAGFLICKKSS